MSVIQIAVEINKEEVAIKQRILGESIQEEGRRDNRADKLVKLPQKLLKGSLLVQRR